MQISPDKKLSILLVDDDTFLLDMYSVKFAKSGFEVKTAVGGEAALKILRDKFSPDVLVLDVVMPTMDGLQLLERIRKEKLAAKAIVIMLTNQSQSEDIDRATTLGVNGYIVKATTIPSEVLTEVMEIIKKQK